MAAGNNTLSESIALITTANTVAQDPTTVGQGIKTVSLRLRSTKTELEQIGEDADGAAENISKLRQQMLALTGVDIQLDDTTYKSTYQILLEISKVWGQLDDLSRSSVLEQLFGKRQSNIGAAILENGELLEKVYKTAEGSAGSARREQEECAKSIQYSLDSLKAAYQDLAQTVIGSDFVRGVVDTAKEFLEILTKIIDKFGALPTLLTGLATVGGFKGIGIFGKNSIGKELLQNVGVLSNAMSDYNSSVDKTVYAQKALDGEIKTGSNSFSKYLSTLNGSEASMSGYVSYLLKANAATLKLEITTMLLNAALNMVAGRIVSGITVGLTKLIHAGEEANKKLKEQQELMAENARKYQETDESTQELYSQYIKLATSTKNLTSEKKKLLDIQEKLNASIDDQTNKVDLLNKSLTENVTHIQEQRKEEARKIIEETQGSYDSIKSGLEADRLAMVTYGDKDVEKAYVKISQATGLDVTGKLTEQSAQISKMLEAYKQIEGYDVNLYNDLVRGQQAIENNVETYKQVVDTHEKALKSYSELNLPAEKQEQFNQLLESATDIITRFNTTTSASEKFTLSQEINDLHFEAGQFAGDNTALAESIDYVFSAYSQGFEDSLGDLESWRDAWFKTLDEIQKSGLKNVETMQNALATLVSGEGLSGDDMWKLIEFDTDGILTDIRQIGDKFYLNESQVVQLKDSYINKSIEQLKIENQLLTTKRQQTDADIIAYQNLLDKYNLTMLDAHNPRYTEYQQEYAQIQKNLDTAKQKTKEYGDQIKYNNILIKQWGAGLGDTVARQKELNNLVKELTDESENLLNAYEGAFDIIIDGYEAEKKALEANKEELQEQLDLLQEQADLIQEQIDNYDKAAEAVKNAIKGEIDALKAQNEERESALDLAEKLANLENAKNNKVRTYTEAGGWQYEAKKADVEKAQREVDKAQTDQRIKALEEYLQKWEDLATKRQKEEDERLAAQILGADWREKIAKQDEDIFKQYEEEYDSYGEQLERISSIETSTVQKSLDNVNKQIVAKDKEIQKWQNYKSEVSSVAQTAKKEMSDWYTEALKIATDMGSDEGKVAGYLDDFYYRYKTILTNLKTYQDELNAAVNNFDPETLGEKFMEIADIDWDKVLDALKEYNRHINSESDARLHAEGYYADGGVASYTGLAMLHGSKQNPELILNAKDTAKLYNMIHNSPTLTPTAITGNMRIAQNLSAKTDTPNSVSVNVANLNLPNVANAEQFARQMESYMQTVLTESQVFKPRR